jgi:4-hydroxy-3-methylbut-2-enyl diphosphate reductase
MAGDDRVRRRVLLAAPRGFCAGVVRAIETVERALELFGAPVYVRRQIVHNPYVVRMLERRGAVFVEETADVPEGAVLVLSAHGVAPAVRAEADARALRTVDATCPLVTKVHREARRLAEAGYDILLIGAEGHDEVVGTRGEAADRIHVIADADEVAAAGVRDPHRVAWLSQTTLTVDETTATVQRLRERFPHLVDPPSEDICYAAQNRQAAVARLARAAELVIVVGSVRSHNSGRLVEVARQCGAPAAYLVDGADGLVDGWLDGVTTVGVAAGASTPEVLVQNVLDWLAARGAGRGGAGRGGPGDADLRAPGGAAGGAVTVGAAAPG